ncbi:hypothetical protein [uncultured Bacteroides sp.]|uniref:hypothetical protein n=1 Tax=uncultured Bacteroides sp. TaxID=162156 RepID=UPI0025968852|nr:hypothetical protein [uncultured Bacteroides sp.]
MRKKSFHHGGTIFPLWKNDSSSVSILLLNHYKLNIRIFVAKKKTLLDGMGHFSKRMIELGEKVYSTDLINRGCH